jgi:hypothetical protein
MWFKRNRWMVVVVLMIATALLLAACGAPEQPPEEKPAIVEPIEGTDLNRVTLTERAAERLDIQTEPVREEQVERTRTLGAEIEVVPETPDEEIPHRIEFTVTDLTKDIAGVRTVVAWIVDYSDGQVVEKELAFYAQDNDGNVWYLGEHPEEYEDGEFIEAPTWVAGVEGAIPGIKMKVEPQQGTPAYFQGWAPAVEWTDYGQVDQMGQEACVSVDCYQDVLVVAESSLEEEDAYQLKYYAPGVGNVQVGWRGADATQEDLELVSYVEQLSPEALADVRAEALAMEKHAYQVSEDVYGQTPPAVQSPDAESPMEPAMVAFTVPEAVPEAEFAEFDPSNFDRSTDIDNEWLPLQPGRQWVYEGITVESAGRSGVWVRVPLGESDMNQVDPSQPAVVLDLDDDGAEGWMAEPDEGPGADDAEDTDLPGEDAAEALYYLVDSSVAQLASGQGVLVELSMLGSGTLHKVIPYAAVIYDLTGKTWVYTSPEPLTFVRQPISIDYIEDDMAVLVDGPDAGTLVATVGVAELYGADTGVGK